MTESALVPDRNVRNVSSPTGIISYMTALALLLSLLDNRKAHCQSMLAWAAVIAGRPRCAVHIAASAMLLLLVGDRDVLCTLWHPGHLPALGAACCKRAPWYQQRPLGTVNF